MDHRSILAPLLALTLLTGCAGNPGGSAGGSDGGHGEKSAISVSPPQTDALPEAEAVLSCRVVTADGTQLLLAGQGEEGDDVYWLDTAETKTFVDGVFQRNAAPAPGALVEIYHGGMVMETFPAQLAEVFAVNLVSQGFDDLPRLYLEVLEDLWEEDIGLNSDLTELGVDLSATRLAPSEQAAVAWAFGRAHGLTPIQGTHEELVEQGYITAAPLKGSVAQFWQWETGCLFSIREEGFGETGDGTNGEAPAPAADNAAFQAQKWRSGTGAYYFGDCTASRDEDGRWGPYTIGYQMIS